MGEGLKNLLSGPASAGVRRIWSNKKKLLLAFLACLGGYDVYTFNKNGCLAFTHCLPDHAYHPVRLAANKTYVNSKGEDAAKLTTMYVDRYGWRAGRAGEESVKASWRAAEFYKAFLEFDEGGDAFDVYQKNAILEKLESLKATGRPVYVVTFIHGWHYNADDNLFDDSQRAASFKNSIKFDNFMARYVEATRRLYEHNGSKQQPAVLGIYVGWRGESMDGWFTIPTIGNRAKAADRIGRNRGPKSLYQALSDIAYKMEGANEDNRMLVFGHSLGGRILSQAFIPEIANHHGYPLGPHVLLAAIEPAIGADCYDSVLSGPRQTQPQQSPGFLAITSEDDTAVGDYYNLSLWAPKVLGPVVNYLLSPPSCTSSDAQWKAIGDYEAYQTHRLEFDYYANTDLKQAADANIGQKEQAESRKSPYQPDGKTFLYPLVDTVGDGILKEGKTFWRYMYYNGETCPKCYDTWDAAYYTMTLSKRQLFDKASVVWNVTTNRRLIDMAQNSSLANGVHNGYVSTNLANYLVRMTFWQKKWARPEAVALPDVKGTSIDILKIKPQIVDVLVPRGGI